MLVVAGGLLGGCAFGDRQASLDYPPAEEDGGMVAAAEAAPAAGGVVYIGDIGDVRSDPSLVGHVRNGWGMKTAKVVAQRDVPGWVREALAYELAAAGFRVADGDAPDGVATVSGDVLRVYCDAYLTYDGEVSLRMAVARGGQRQHEKTYLGTGSAGLSWAATGKCYSQSLSLALRDALRQFTGDLARMEN